MKKVLLSALMFAVTAPVLASADLAKAKNCMACHAMDKKLVGPSYKDVAAKYQGQAGAADQLAKKIRAGGKGVWGPMPMPANPQVSEAEAKQLVDWILKIK